ncbi:hypothetical protein ACHAXR_010150 [Thalassiosira sp. AJA248-18]
MKVRFHLSMLCVISTSRITQGGIQSQMLSNDVVDWMANTEIFNASKALLISQEDPTDATPRNASCSSTSEQWLRLQVRNVSGRDLSNFFDWHVYTLPFAYKLFVEPKQQHSSNDKEYFGLDGEYTEEMNYILEQALDFWAHSGVDDEIRLLGAHGPDLADRDRKLIPTLEVLFGGSYDDEYTILDHATDIQDLISRLPQQYNYPLLTFNSFATDKINKNDYASIIIGDGYFEFQRSVGLASEGPEYALTHEYAHHLQFALGAPEGYGLSQTTRKQELMADAFSAYYLAHTSGGYMAPEEISNIHKIAYSLGDCEMSNVDRHHGTPRQRWCATMWGASVADLGNSANMDLIQLMTKFDTWYNRLDIWYKNLDNLSSFCEHGNSAAPFTSNHVVQYLKLLAVTYGSIGTFIF